MGDKDKDLFNRYKEDMTSEPAYLEEEEETRERNQALSTKINWENYEQYVSKKEVHLLVDYDRPGADKLELFVAHGSVLARAFMVLIVKIVTNDDHLRYILTLLDDLLTSAQNSKDARTDLPTVLSFFSKLRSGKPDPSVPHLPFGAISTVLTRKIDDPYMLALAGRILTTFLTKIPDVSPDIVETFFRWYIDELLAKEHNKLHERKISLGLIALRPLLSVDRYRVLFVADPQNLQVILKLSIFEDKREGALNLGKNKKSQKSERKEDKKGPNYQQIYESVFLLWCLSFNGEVQQRLTEPKLIYNLCHILRRCNKVKVIRISLSVLRNLLGVSKNNELMLSYGIMSSLSLLKQKRWGDEELEGNIKHIEETLEKNVDDLTSWDKYRNEVLASQLEWSPPHKSVKFWQENHSKFEEDDYLLLRKLKEILENNHDLKVLCIACWDIGEFVRVHPHGKLISKTLELKTPVMRILTEAEKNRDPGQNDDEDAQKLAKEALTALQKLMITNWEYLQQ
jgi:V-type H+-transporting ATPase subunit H